MIRYAIHNTEADTFMAEGGRSNAEAEFQPLNTEDLPRMWESRYWADNAREDWLAAHPDVPAERVVVVEVPVTIA